MPCTPGSIDLHTHSTFSDGTCTPTEILALAAENELAAVALTDHDTTAGLPEFLESSRSYPALQAIPGVELSTRYGARELHIVGLFIDHTDPALLEYLAREQERRAKRNRDMKIKLALLGYPLDDDEPAFAAAGGMGANLGRPHFAQALMEKYHFPDLRSVFEKLLGNNKPAYIPRENSSPREAIAAIHASGGLAVWAHPIYRDRNERAYVRRVARKLSALGLDAMEGYYSLFGPPETQLVTEAAAQFDLLLSGGSDFHGERSPNINLGCGAGKLNVPAVLLEKLNERSAQKRVLLPAAQNPATPI
ncbi:MAG: PHP domain-containing protein [Lentisphaerae bacterium]|nr:PHP domain-containing protein [Lentisphaerota bacterium]MBR2873201.1 PHP domain-containing protein [Lentisphaeria bacterium]